jgi:streptomycin 6-kinase
MLRIPSSLDWWRAEAGGSDWLGRLPAIVADCAEQWSLELGDPISAHISLVVTATAADGAPAILKVNFPDEESEHEADALAHWGGEGAVLLLAHDAERQALLVERCDPGTELWSVSDEEEANRIAASALRRLWRPAPIDAPFRRLDDLASRWAEELPARWERLGRPFEGVLLDAGVSWLRELGPTQSELVVAHQDFHGGNLLRASREPWLAIDPKPVLAEREFDTASLLRDRRDELEVDAAPSRRIRRRLDQLADELGLDRERMRGWALAHALAWGFDGDGADPSLIACARWFAEAA